MIRLSANLSRKVPVPGIEFSSQQYGASMEIEVSDADLAADDRLQTSHQSLGDGGRPHHDPPHEAAILRNFITLDIERRRDEHADQSPSGGKPIRSRRMTV